MTATKLGIGIADGALLGDSSAVPTHAPFPPRGQPRLLIPRYPAAAVVASIRRYTVPQSVRARLAVSSAIALARLGALRLAPGAIPLGGPFITQMRKLLEVEELAFSVHLGPPRANRKPVLHLMDLSGESVAYVKLGINDLTCRRVREEAEALRRLGDVTMPGLVAPGLIASGTWDGLEYLVMKPLDSDSALIPSRRLREKAIDALVAAFPVQTLFVRDSPWWSRAMADLIGCDASPERERLLRAAEACERAFGDRAMTVGASHGDWSRWNMSVRDSEVVVWDWERFATDVPVGWDELHFRLGLNPGGPARALARGRVRPRVAGKELPKDDAEPLLATYLIHRGVSRLKARQETGIHNAALGEWLLTAVENSIPEREGGAV